MRFLPHFPPFCPIQFALAPFPPPLESPRMTRIGLIGCGKMGSALLRGVAAADDSLTFALSDVVPAAVESLKNALGGSTSTGTPDTAASQSDVVILAVKPGDLRGLCESLATVAGDRLYLSIAAGVKIADLEAWLGTSGRVIRVMPNTPALVGAGAAAFAKGSRATESDAETARTIFGAVGTVDEVSEKLLDAVTGLSGSGPAYVYTVIEALADGGVLMGLPRATALQLAAQTVAGAAKMVLETGSHPAVLRDQVTSPGGTTAAGLEQLEAHGLPHALIQAVRKATERSVELGG